MDTVTNAMDEKMCKDFYNYDGSYKLTKSILDGAADNIVEGVIDLGDAIIYTAQHPMEAFLATKSIIDNPEQFVIQIYNGVEEDFTDEVLNGDVFTTLHYAGGIAGEITVGIFVGKGLNKVSKSLKKGKYLDNAAKGAVKTAYSSTDDAASFVAKNLDGTLTELKNGYKIEVPNGKKPIVVRVMNEGLGGRPNDYFRVSIDGKGSLTLDGVLSNDKGLTHIDLADGYLEQITDMIMKYQGR